MGGDHGSVGGSLSLADFNGDGLADVWHAREEDKQVQVWMNAGGGLFYGSTVERPRPALDVNSRFRYRRTAVLDYNGDGHSDLLENWQFIDNLGDELRPHNVNTGLLPDSITSLFAPVDVPELKFVANGQVFNASFDIAGDVDGDGNRDVFNNDGQVFYGSGARNTLLSRVTDGLGNVVRVTYDGGDTYHHDEHCSTKPWPEKCVTTLTGLVSTHTEGFIRASGEEVRERTFTYHYLNAHANLTGHGWLGFDRRTIDAQAIDGGASTTTIDYEPIARYDLSGKPTQSTTPPYLYPLAGLPKTTTVDLHVGSPGAAQPPLQDNFYDRRTQTINNWTVKLSQFSRPFPVVASRDVTTYDRPVTGGGSTNPTRPPFEDNGVFLTECFDVFDVDGYGNVFRDNQKCQLQETSLEHTITTTLFRPDAVSWLISNPENIEISSERGTLAKREFALTYSGGLLATVTRAPNGTADQQLTTTYTRDDFGNVTQIREGAASGPARTTTVTYDADNVFPSTVTNAAGQATQLQFDSRWGEPKAVVDPNGIAVQIAYDNFGKRTQTSGPEGSSISSYSSIATPNVISAIGTVEPRIQVSVELQGTEGTHGGSSVTEYDNYGRVVRTRSEGFGSAEVIQEQAYDSLGRALGQTLPHTSDLTTIPFDRYSYDDLHRLTRVDHSDGSFKEYQYASSASLITTRSQWLNGMTCDHGLPLYFCAVGFALTKDEEGRQNAVVTDYRGRVVRNIDGNNIESGAQSSNYVFGAFNQLFQARDNHNLLTEFDHDDYGRLASQIDPDTDASTYRYNGFDELQTSIDPAKQLRTYEHDSLGRLVSIVDRDGTTQWIYDQGVNALGSISESISPSTAENPAGQHIRYSYEAPTATGNRGLLQTVTYAIDGTDYAIHLDHDDLGRTARIHYPSQVGGQPIIAQYRYDTSGVLNGLDEIGSRTAKPLWRLNNAFQGHLIQHETFGNGAKAAYGYNSARRWLDNVQTTLGSEQIQSLEYTHFNNGQVHGVNAAGTSPVEYQYDNLNRLSAVNTISDVPTGTLYSYDDLGNLTSRGPTVTSYRNGTPHLIDKVGDNAYLYDLNGNVSTRSGPEVPGGSQSFSYTPFNLPRSIDTGASTTGRRSTRFDYSADEERLVRRDEDSTRHFIRDLYQRQFDSFGTTLEERFRLYAGDRQIGEIVRKDGTDRTLYFHTDHLGSTQTISDSTGSATTQHFDPFGAPIAAPNPELTRVGFTGQDQDVDLGLTDMKGRIYDPLAGRFTSADPFMQAPFWSQGLNRYSYVFNDPINKTDPSGFLADGGDSTLAISGWGAGVVGLAATLSSSGGGWGLLGGGANIGATLLSGGYPGTTGIKGGTYSGPTPSAAPAAAGGGQGSLQATGQNQGGIGAAQALPRFQGGASGSINGEGGHEGDAGGADKHPIPAADAGAYLEPDSGGLYKLTPAGRQSLSPIFDKLGYDLNRARFKFVWLDEDGTQAETDGDLVKLDPSNWNSSVPYRQARLLTHELTHSVQFDKIGYVRTRVRIGIESYTYGNENYTVPGKLHKLPLEKLNVGDSRFSLESIAEHVAQHVRPF